MPERPYSCAVYERPLIRLELRVSAGHDNADWVEIDTSLRPALGDQVTPAVRLCCESQSVLPVMAGCYTLVARHGPLWGL